MKQKVFTSFILLAFLLLPRPAFAQEKTINNIAFQVTQIDRSFSDAKRSDYIGIRYQLTNGDEQKKFLLDTGISYRLIDEFGNQYRKISPPPGKEGEAAVLPKGFPSLYPGETYGEEVFFEPPIPKANHLKFQIIADSLGVRGPIELAVVLDPDIPNSVKIADPQDGTVLQQGQVAHLNINLTGRKPPKRLVVMALNTVFEDNSPSLENVYDINVPIDLPVGTYNVNVIAYWQNGPDIQTGSDLITLYVKDSMPMDVF